MKQFVVLIVLVAVCSVSAQNTTSESIAAIQVFENARTAASNVPLGSIVATFFKTLATTIAIVAIELYDLTTTGSLGQINESYPDILVTSLVDFGKIPVIGAPLLPFFLEVIYIFADVIQLIAAVLGAVFTLPGQIVSFLASTFIGLLTKVVNSAASIA